MKVKVKGGIEAGTRKEREGGQMSQVCLPYLPCLKSLPYMQRQRTQVSCADMFALLNQSHGSEKSLLWSVSQCGRPEVCSVHSSVVHKNVVLPHCKVRAQPTVWLSSVRWAWNRSRWGERACELPRFTLEPSSKYRNLLQNTPNVLYFVEPYEVH